MPSRPCRKGESFSSGSTASTPAPCSPWPTPVPACRPRFATRSSRCISPPKAVAPGSGCTWPATWRSRAAAPSAWIRRPAKAPASRSTCRCWDEDERMPRALVVDDDVNFRSGLAELVQREGFTVAIAGTLAEAKPTLTEDPPDVVLMDLGLPDGGGLELLDLPPPGSRTEFIVITGIASVESAVDALRNGVLDYLTKPVDIPRLKSVLANLTRTTELKVEIGSLRKQLRELGRFGRLIGGSPAMQRVYDLIARVAPTNASVLLTGESGTGKEMVAQTIHELSRRRRGPFLPLNCGAMPAGLVESELFGHERGSFTGATQLRRGHFERASSGTLMLDEIAEMPIELQVKLLRVLETGAAIRVGGDTPVQVDARVIAATNRAPEQAVADGKLREDLLYRLNVFPVELPPLRDRGGDAELLAAHFLEELNRAEGATKHFAPGAEESLRG